VEKNFLNSVNLFCTKLLVKLGKRRVSTTLCESGAGMPETSVTV